MNTTCTFEQRAAQTAACIRTRAAVQDLPRVIGEAYSSIMKHLDQLGIEPTGMPYCAYYNMDMQDLELEIGFPIATAIEGKGDVQPSELRGGNWATLMNIGPYDSVGPSYEKLTKAIAERGTEIIGPAYEFYFDGPETPPERIRTLIGFPVK